MEKPKGSSPLFSAIKLSSEGTTPALNIWSCQCNGCSRQFDCYEGNIKNGPYGCRCGLGKLPQVNTLDFTVVGPQLLKTVKYTVWECRCFCNEIFYQKGITVPRRQFGCHCNVDSPKIIKPDSISGEFEVLDMIRGANGRPRWRWKCLSCDGIFDSDAGTMREKKIGCGCHKYLNVPVSKSGKIVAINMAEKTFEAKKCKWNCVCQCGRKLVLKTGNIRMRKIGCGFCEPLVLTPPVPTTHEFKVLGLSVFRENGSHSWRCWCYCNKEFCASHQGIPLKKCGCGCTKRNRYIGLRFDKLEITEYLGRSKTGGSIYKAKCECGNYKRVSSNRFSAFASNSNLHLSCGCAPHPNYKGNAKISGSYWCNILHGAQIRSIPMNLTIDEASGIFDAQNSICALTGRKLTLGNAFVVNRGKDASLDRKDSRLDYSVGNCEWIWKPLNNAKRAISRDRYIRLCSKVCNPSPHIEHEIYKLTQLYFRKRRYGARDKDIRFEITFEYASELFEKQNGQCALTGICLKIPRNLKEYLERYGTASIDRIIPGQKQTLGYIEGNIRWVHKDVNFMRNNLSDKAFREICYAVYHYQTTGKVYEKQ